MDEFKAELVVIGARLNRAEAALAGFSATLESVSKDVSRLKKVIVGGYVQTRYNVFQGDPNSSTIRPPASNFNMRRARLKIAARPTDDSLVILQFDAGQNYIGSTPPTVAIRDAYLEYRFGDKPANRVNWLAGQMKWPFGYEIPQSSTVRESPERSLVMDRLFPGARDRGSYVTVPISGSGLHWKFGGFNGVPQTFSPPTDAKAMVTTLRAGSGSLQGGVSGWYGGRIMDKAGTWYYMATEPKTRVGADVQYYGKHISIKAEYIRGVGVDGADSAKPFDPAVVSEAIEGMWAQIAWSFSAPNTLAVKFETLSDDPLYPQFGRRSAWNLGLLRWLDDKTRLKLYYIINQEQDQSFPNNAFIGEWITVF
jgi:hypothetical protein